MRENSSLTIQATTAGLYLIVIGISLLWFRGTKPSVTFGVLSTVSRSGWRVTTWSGKIIQWSSWSWMPQDWTIGLYSTFTVQFSRGQKSLSSPTILENWLFRTVSIWYLDYGLNSAQNQVFKCYSRSQIFDNPTALDHLNTRLVPYFRTYLFG